MSTRATTRRSVATAASAAVLLALACSRNGAPNQTSGHGGAGHGGSGMFDAGSAAGQPGSPDAAIAGQDGAAGQTDASAAGQGGGGAPGRNDASAMTDAADASDGTAGAGDASSASSITVTLAETPEAFRNPMKGFRPSRYIGDATFKDSEYASTYKHYIPYSALESSAGDTPQKIKDWSDANWGALRARNRKVIPRVVIVYPGTGEYWGDIPHDGTPDQWTTAALQARLVAFVAKLGQAWDDDPRVAAVEMGLWGKWGEQNIYPDTVAGSDRIPAGLQKALGDAFVGAFKKKKVLVRYPTTFTDYTTFGFYWDSFALPDDDNAGGGAGIVARDVWRSQMISGEVAYDWGDQSKLGGSPNGTLSSATNTDYVIGVIQKLHASSLGWIAEYAPDGGAISANAARMQKALGYRFVVKDVTFTASIAPGGALNVALTVANVGNAPFYYKWPVELSLLDASHQPVWRATFANADTTQWLPGASTVLKGTFIPTAATGGTYTLAVAVLDPSASAPSLRFANKNYYRGGRTPIGRISIGAATPPQDLGSFDGLKSDDTLSY